MDKAIEDYTQAIDYYLKNPTYFIISRGEVYNLRGCAYLRKKEYFLAISDFDKAIRIISDKPIFYSNRGTAFYLIKDYSKALKDFEKVLSIDPNNVKAKNAKSFLLKNI